MVLRISSGKSTVLSQKAFDFMFYYIVEIQTPLIQTLLLMSIGPFKLQIANLDLSKTRFKTDA